MTRTTHTRSTHRTFALAATGALALAPGLILAGPASAADGTYDLSAQLTELNDSGASSDVTGTLDGNELTLSITSSGLLAGAPHAQHVHIGGAGTCPDPGLDPDGDGALETTEAADAYGAIQVSLTTEGDTSPDSGLAVDRFPVGDTTYERTVEVSDEVAQAVAAGEAVVVQHGVDLDGSGAYDGETMSDLDPSLPQEATVPAVCGVLSSSMAMPDGGADTGAGGASDGTELGLLGAGLGLVAVGAGAYAVRRRSSDAKG
ncbi:hypothetical protein WDV85_03735 [Pseudokineococcus sp. 5B2Z-1]|uniref:hypothetical protein n=1 Tax=Pseudokineococcus sp. 5B2Z-1 TaxID=3132744 RepID=UPI0030A6A008